MATDNTGDDTVATLTPPLKWHGGKNYLAPRIIALMPPRCKKPNKPDPADPGWLHYVEPYAGGLAVLLANDPEGISEVVNDINFDLTNFWRALAGRDFSEFVRTVQATPFSETEWQETGDFFEPQYQQMPPAQDPTPRAAAFFIRCRQSLAGRMKAFTGITRTRTRRGMNAECSAWLTVVEGLPAVHARLSRVLIKNRDAMDVICEEDGPRTLFYLDPPYLHETRATTGEYAHEMSDVGHASLLELLSTVKGRFLLSGYRSAMYDDAARMFGWKRHDFDIANHAAGGDTKRRMTECVWANFARG